MKLKDHKDQRDQKMTERPKYTAKGLAKLNKDWIKAGCWATRQIIEDPEDPNKKMIRWVTVQLNGEQIVTPVDENTGLDLAIDSVKLSGPPGSSSRIAKMQELYAQGIDPFKAESNEYNPSKDQYIVIPLRLARKYLGSSAFMKEAALVEKLYD